MMQDMRKLLSQEPMTFNELLDLFEGYLSVVHGEINKGHDLLREEIGAGEHVALGHIFGVACDAEDMAKRLGRVRDARNAGTDVTVTMTRADALILGEALREVVRMVEHAASVFALLSRRKWPDDEDEGYGARAILYLANRALLDADDRDSAHLRRFASILNEATHHPSAQREEAA